MPGHLPGAFPGYTSYPPCGEGGRQSTVGAGRPTRKPSQQPRTGCRPCGCPLRLKVGSNNPAFTPLTLSSSEPSWQMMRHGLKVEVLSLKHRPSHRYLNMRQEYRTFKSVASCPCDWLLFNLSYKGRRSSIKTKTNGKIDE